MAVTIQDGLEDIAADDSSADYSSMDSSALPESYESYDRGQECREHRYVLSAGASEILNFSTMLPIIEKNRPRQFNVSRDEIKDTGVTVNLNYVDYQDFTDVYPVWALDYSQHYHDLKAEFDDRSRKNPNIGYGVELPLEIQINNFRIALYHDMSRGLAIITRLGNANTARSVGQLSREEVTSLLGLQNPYEMIHVQNSSLGRQTPTPLIESTGQEQRTIMNYTVSVTTPVEGGIRDTRNRRISFVSPESGRGISVGVTSMWGMDPDPNAIHFVISGPAEEIECFRGY